jgi:hypothetical protein
LKAAKAVVEEPAQPKIKLKVNSEQDAPAPPPPKGGKKITIHVGGQRDSTAGSPTLPSAESSSVGRASITAAPAASTIKVATSLPPAPSTVVKGRLDAPATPAVAGLAKPGAAQSVAPVSVPRTNVPPSAVIGLGNHVPAPLPASRPSYHSGVLAPIQPPNKYVSMATQSPLYNKKCRAPGRGRDWSQPST